MEQTERAYSVHASRRHVLQESAKKLVSCESHCFASMVATVAVGESDRFVIAVQDRLVGQGRAMHVAAKVFEHALWTLDSRLGKGNPSLAPRDLGKPHTR
jgi:hypothetical protein